MEKIEVIADFLCNGLEHSSLEEAAGYLVEEAGMNTEKARDLAPRSVEIHRLSGMFVG